MKEELDYKKYRLDDGLLYYQGRLCIHGNHGIKLAILSDCHIIPIAGHLGFNKTY